MAIPDQHFPENTLRNIKKFLGYTQKESTQKGNEISFWAFLLSLFIYIFIFYKFNLSPFSVLNTTKFWFFISNTLILIIAADFGAFSLSRKQEDSYYDYYVKSSEKNNIVIVRSQYHDIVNSTLPLVKVDSPREEIKEIVQVDDCETKPLKNNLQIILKKDFKKLSEKYDEDVPRFTRQVDKDYKSCDKIVRTISKLSVAINDLEDKSIIRQNESECYDHKEKGDAEESEFSRMSNEELNRRVEEFIRRSNRQIRLQATRNKFNKLR